MAAADDVRADLEVSRRAQRTDGVRGVQITQGNVLMGDQMDFLLQSVTMPILTAKVDVDLKCRETATGRLISLDR